MTVTEYLKLLTTPCQNLHPGEADLVFHALEKEISQARTAVGLAAPQIGILKRAFIIKLKGQIYRFSNTTIESGRYPKHQTEQCLSIPGRDFRVERNNRVVVTDDINGTEEYRHFLAQVIQHEHDHTQGITLLQSGEEVNKII